MPIGKATGRVTLICKQFHASVIAKTGLSLNNTINKYSETDKTSRYEIINTNIKDLRSKFFIDNIIMDNHCFLAKYWLPKMHKTPIKARFIAAFPKSSNETPLLRLSYQHFSFFISRSKI